MPDRSRPASEPYVWLPLDLRDVVRRMQGFDAPWWIAGGQAIDAFLGYESRAHGDIDIACFREDQLAMQRHLGDLQLYCAEQPHGLRPWLEDEWLEEPIHDIWARQSDNAPWCLQIMLDQRHGENWVYRRNPAVRLPLHAFITRRGGIPYIAVEVQLLYKAPAADKVPKNMQDFENCLPSLSVRQRQWLVQALRTAHPGHAWIEKLSTLDA